MTTMIGAVTSYAEKRQQSSGIEQMQVSIQACN
jgi:hypothetical protein